VVRAKTSSHQDVLKALRARLLVAKDDAEAAEETKRDLREAGASSEDELGLDAEAD